MYFKEMESQGVISVFRSQIYRVRMKSFTSYFVVDEDDK